MTTLNDAPIELKVSIQEFWPPEEWDNAAGIAFLESGFNAFALNDTASEHGCGAIIRQQAGVKISAERSVGYFQIDSCQFPDWEWQRLYNARHNAGTAHMLWEQRGWSPWYFSSQTLGIA